MSNIDYSTIKLVIWDLDETLWKGTISEEEISIPDAHKVLIKRLTDCGIVNSICSKNNYDEVKKILESHGLWDLFVFPSINWESKGQRIRDIILSMNLRDVNVLFIDDNSSNLEEAVYYNSNIKTLNAHEITELIEYASNLSKSDSEHKRLKQYKVLEAKWFDQRKSVSNEEFLYNCNIQVDLKTDCKENIDRLYELVHRTNQLNFTKLRQDRNEFEELITDESIEKGYITARDNYGEYGIIGFYAKKSNQLVHFLFSCRTLGMGIEQYVYSVLDYPALTVIGEVATSLNNHDCSPWINQNKGKSKGSLEKNEVHVRTLLKGPCDMMQIFSFIQENEWIDTEFTYVGSNGCSIEQHNHTECIREAFDMAPEKVTRISSEIPMGDAGMFSRSIYDKKYDIVFLSLLTDGGLGLYRNKETDTIIAFGEYVYPITDINLWDKYINGEIPSSGVRFSREELEKFANKYEFVGRISTDRIIDNIKYIRSKMSKKTTLVLLTGAEIAYKENKLENYKDRHLFNQELNRKLEVLQDKSNNVHLIKFGDYVHKQSDFYNNINHFIKPIYYEIAKAMINEINSISSEKEYYVRSSGRIYAFLAHMKQIYIKKTKKDKFNIKR